MLKQCSKICEQILKGKTICDSSQSNVTHPFYDNHEAKMHFIKYLRKRQVTVGSNPEGKWNDCTERPAPGMFVKLKLPEFHDFTAFYFTKWFERKKDQYLKFIEKSVHKQYQVLGPDLAAAMFVIKNGGKVKFKDHDKWIDKTTPKEVLNLPNKYDPNYILEELDLNKYPLRYEHLHFIFELYYVKYLNLRGCKTIDDWALDKLSAEYPMLECLDISECEGVTERGLEALYRMPNLKKLIVTNFHGTAAFDLTCFMLEDVNPHLTCQVHQLKHKQLLEN